MFELVHEEVAENLASLL